MSGYQKYVAIQEFSLNVSKNGETKTLQIKVGDALDFDDITVKISGDEQGTAAALRKVKGEWIEAYNGSDEFLAKIQEKIRGKAVKPQTLRTVIANSTVEHSSPNTDHDISKKPKPGTHEELKTIVNDPEDGDKDVASKIINDDQHVVATVSKVEDSAEVRSSSTVELSDVGEAKKLEIVSDEDTVAKRTSYDRNTEAPKKAQDDNKISVEEDAVIETDYKDPEKTDIGSSTKAQVVEKPAKAKSSKKAAKKTVKKASSRILKESAQAAKNNKNDEKDILDSIVVDEGPSTPLNQDGVVVKKTSPIEVDGSVRDIESTLTVGGNEETDGAVTFSSNNTIDEGEATFSGSGESAPVEVSTETATVITESDDGIDVTSLLDDL
jgi:hypothetical protein